MRILLVDDHDAVRDATQRVLTHGGHQVSAFASAAAATEAFRKAPGAFDGALLDVNIGYEDGVALAIALRAISATLPIAFVTGSEISAERARVHGAVLAKPCAPNDLLALVDGLKSQ